MCVNERHFESTLMVQRAETVHEPVLATVVVTVADDEPAELEDTVTVLLVVPEIVTDAVSVALTVGVFESVDGP